jgi:hypothetical protein
MTNHNPADEAQEMWQSQKTEVFTMSQQERVLMLQRTNRQSRIWYSPLIPIAVLLLFFSTYVVLYHFEAVDILGGSFHAQSLIVRVGFYMMLVGGAYAVYEQWRFMRAKNAAFARAEVLGTTGSLAFYRAELQREVDLGRMKLKSLTFLFGFVVIQFGVLRNMHGQELIRNCVFLGVMFAVMMVGLYFERRQSNRYRRKIAALDELMREQGDRSE